MPTIDVEHIEPNRVAQFLLEHLVPGVALNTFTSTDIYGNLNHNPIALAKMDIPNEHQWTLNGIEILSTDVLSSRLSAVFIDGILGDHKITFTKRNIQEVVNRYNAPERLEMKNATKEEQLRQNRREQRPSALLTFLAGMKSGTKVFQHFLTKSNLTQELDGMRAHTLAISGPKINPV